MPVCPHSLQLMREEWMLTTGRPQRGEVLGAGISADEDGATGEQRIEGVERQSRRHQPDPGIVQQVARKRLPVGIHATEGGRGAARGEGGAGSTMRSEPLRSTQKH